MSRLPCLKQKAMHQTAVAQGVCIACSKAAVAAAAAAPAAAALAVQQSGWACCRGQATNSACHPAESLVVLLGPLLPQRKVRTHT